MLVLGDMAASRIAFYATAATVLPVIMLAISFQMRADTVFRSWLNIKRVSKRNGLALLVSAGFILFVLIAGELEAIFSLADGRSEGLKVVEAAFSFGAILLFIGVFDQASDQIREAIRTDLAAMDDEVYEPDGTAEQSSKGD